MKHKLLFFRILILALLVVSCGVDHRIDYDAHPELLEIKSAHPGPYKKMVKMYSDHYADNGELNELVVKQAHAIKGAYLLMSPAVSTQYSYLTEQSGRDAFFIELERFEVEIENSEEMPLIDWVKIESNMIRYLEIRNERVRELRMSSDSTSANPT